MGRKIEGEVERGQEMERAVARVGEVEIDRMIEGGRGDETQDKGQEAHLLV